MPETTWSEGLIARYLTVGGATVDLTHKSPLGLPDQIVTTWASCTGCPASKEFPHGHSLDIRFACAPRDEKRTPQGADELAREWAQSHADSCRAMPRPTT
jgi:hypothetical protein